MQLAVSIYLTIGAIIALAVLKLLKDPPEYDKEWELLRTGFFAAPQFNGPILFGLLLFAWPVIFLGPLFREGE